MVIHVVIDNVMRKVPSASYSSNSQIFRGSNSKRIAFCDSGLEKLTREPCRVKVLYSCRAV